jgi:uncharacterized membrane protein YdjX (TVP38/TMEM64 family)
MPRRPPIPGNLIVLLLLVLIGLILEKAGVIDWHGVRERLEPVSHQWWLPPLLAGMQAGLYALALPGSALILVTALLYTPLSATLITVAGGLAGSLAARHAARRVGDRQREQTVRSPTYRLLERHSDFFTLLLVRILPGFPHSIINYGCGLLKVEAGRFALATAIGFTIKGYLYATAIYEAGEADDPADMVRIDTLWPLLVLAGLLAAGHLFRYYRLRRRRP